MCGSLWVATRPPSVGRAVYDALVIDPANGSDWLALTDEPLRVDEALSWVGGPAWGAVTSFLGLVRDNGGGRSGITAIDYEAYEEHVVPRFTAIASDARKNWPELGRIVIWHRIGFVPVGEASVAVVVSAPHRGETFEACRFLIDTLKTTVPIWKREHWSGGSDWSPATQRIAR